MKLGIIGLGQAGGRIADLFCYHNQWGIHGKVMPLCLAVNSARADLLGLKVILKRDRILIGQTEVRGHGVGMVREMGRKVTKEAIYTIMHATMERGAEYVDAFMVVAGLGGGTGSGGAPVLVEELRHSYGVPVYVLGILPSQDEGKLMAQNALECLEELKDVADGILLFDNNLWKREGLPLEKTYNQMNHALVSPFPIMLGAGEAKNRVGIKVLDASDIINSWKGYSVIGHSQVRGSSLLSKLPFRKRVSTDEVDTTLRDVTAIKTATTGGLSSRCQINRTKQGLMLLAGAKRDINVEGYSRARKWLEDVTGTLEIRSGDYPFNSNEVHGVILLSGFEPDDLPRIREMKEEVSA